MVLSTEWSQVEVIDLINDGSGLGFGIVGGKSTGVVIKSILPGGIADKDTRLQSGDHIIQIGDVNLRGFSADQVASVLRQTGQQVKIVVARPVESTAALVCNIGPLPSSAPVVPTKILTDPEELDRQLVENGYAPILSSGGKEGSFDDENEDDSSQIERGSSASEYDINLNNNINKNGTSVSPDNLKELICVPIELEYTLPETEIINVELTKNEFGLGITIAGYVCESQDLSGIFVKSLSQGSEAYNCNKIQLNDRIIEVDGQTLINCSNYEAVRRIKTTGNTVKLKFQRYLRGPKFEHLRDALASQDEKDISPASPSATTLSWIPIESNEVQIDPEGESETSVNSEIYETAQTREIFIEENFTANPESDLETAIKTKWQNIIGTGPEIVVANLTKLKGLGISLEGTVDVEGGIELRPHHYIRSILPEGPVGQNGKLCSGDELLEVNGQKLLGIQHIEVVKILKDLPGTVRLVCARSSEEKCVINTSQDLEGFEARNILGGSLKNLLPRLIKALSDSSLNTSSTVTSSADNLRAARSLEGATCIAMWSDVILNIDLVKTDKGLGFSILDYQDPLDAKSSVIVVRSVVPNGAAEQDGRIKAGDKLVSVNGVGFVKNVTLDQAVQVLKGVLPGIVRLGVAKPLPSSRDASFPSSCS